MSFEATRLFEFRKRGDRRCELVRYLQPDNPAITEIEVPPLHYFRIVRSVEDKAFKGAAHLRSIKLPDTVATVATGAFEDCRALEDVTLPKKLEIINGRTFFRCNSLRRFVLPDSVVLIRSDAFSECAELEEVVLPRSDCMIYNVAFSGCRKLKSMVFPEIGRITFVGHGFRDCPLLPPEVYLYTLIGCNDLSQPIHYNACFNWDTALRRDVFELALEHNSLVHVSKPDLFRKLIERGLSEHVALARGMIDRDLLEKLIDYSAEQGQTEITAQLLNIKSGGREKSVSQKIDEMFDL